MRTPVVTLGLVLGAACSAPAPDLKEPPGPMSPPPTAFAAPTDVTRAVAPQGRAEPLTVEFLGVAGFLLTRGGEQVMTPPLFTRPSLLDVNTGKETRSDVAGIAARFPRSRVAGLKAVLVGHAHYDHLIDAPAVQANSEGAVLYGNSSMKNLLAALSPTRPAGCPPAGPRAVTLEDERVVALDAPNASVVDYRNCPSLKPAGAPLEGSWVRVPNSNIRFMALCSSHPDQFGPVHFAPGHVEQPQCELPLRPDGWKEGATLSYLVDFLDPVSGLPTMRVYYQDSPGKDPVGNVPRELLDGKVIDLALLCVGSSGSVPDEPTRTMAALSARFALGGHWEDFFRSAEQSPTPIPFLNLQEWKTRAGAAMSGADDAPMRMNGSPVAQRAVVPNPNDVFVVAPR